jgi:hypothetical protein
VYISYVKGVSEKLKCIGMIFRAKHTLRSVHEHEAGKRSSTDGTMCVCECDRSYIGETGRPLVWDSMAQFERSSGKIKMSSTCLW